MVGLRVMFYMVSGGVHLRTLYYEYLYLKLWQFIEHEPTKLEIMAVNISGVFSEITGYFRTI